MKRMGVRPGVSDYILPIAKGVYNSLFIELKPSVKGYYPKISIYQVDWRRAMRRAGNAAFIVKGWEQAIEIMLAYVNLDTWETLDNIYHNPASGFDG